MVSRSRPRAGGARITATWLTAIFAFGGRLADTVGHRRMVVLGVLVFAGASACCGLTPTGSLAEAWLITFRAVQGFGGAIMFPAALAIVVQNFALRERGRARNYAASLGLAVLGTVLVTDLRTRLTDSLVAQGLPHDQAEATAAHLSQVQTQSGGSGSGSGGAAAIPQFFREDFAHATQTVFHWMAVIMAVAAVVAIVGLRRGVQAEVAAADQEQPLPSGRRGGA